MSVRDKIVYNQRKLANICVYCGKKGANSGRLCVECKIKTHEQDKKRYIKNRESINKRVSIKQKTGRQEIAKYKLSKGCNICGYNRNSSALAFHHINTKKRGIAEMVGKSQSIITIFKEIEKCILLCHNCHTEQHFPEYNNYEVNNE